MTSLNPFSAGLLQAPAPQFGLRRKKEAALYAEINTELKPHTDHLQARLEQMLAHLDELEVIDVKQGWQTQPGSGSRLDITVALPKHLTPPTEPSSITIAMTNKGKNWLAFGQPLVQFNTFYMHRSEREGLDFDEALHNGPIYRYDPKHETAKSAFTPFDTAPERHRFQNVMKGILAATGFLGTNFYPYRAELDDPIVKIAMRTIEKAGAEDKLKALAESKDHGVEWFWDQR